MAENENIEDVGGALYRDNAKEAPAQVVEAPTQPVEESPESPVDPSAEPVA